MSSDIQSPVAEGGDAESDYQTGRLVQLQGVSKSFACVRVLKDVDFDVRPGEIHALLGENGAGKSTLIKIIAGVHAPDSGVIRIGDEELKAITPREAARGGIATVYQELLLFPELTVAENVFLGHAPKTGLGTLDWSLMRRTARQLLDSLDSHDLDVDAKVGTLSVANWQIEPDPERPRHVLTETGVGYRLRVPD